MVTRYFAPIGTVSSGGSGTSSTATSGGTQALNGIPDLKSRGPGLSSPGDIWKARTDLGSYTLAEKSGTPYTGSSTAGIVDASLGGSLIIGSAVGNNGNMNGRTFDLQGGVFDGRGGISNANRFRAFLVFQGEQITLLCNGSTIYGGNLNFLTGGVVNLATVTYIDNATRENTGLLVLGNGNVIDKPTCIGVTTSGWCAAALEVLVASSNISNSTNGLRTIVRNPVTTGGNEGIKLGIWGGVSPAKDDVWLIVENPRISDPCFGWDGVMPKRAYSALEHGNGIQIEQNLGGRCIVIGDGGTTPHITGLWQDGISMPGAFQVVRYITLQNIGMSTTIHHWVKSGSTWGIRTKTNAEGNGIKCGLLKHDGVSPNPRLGTNGVNGGLYNVPAHSAVLAGVKVHGCNGRAFTTNGSKDLSVISCESVDSIAEALVISNNGMPANALIQNCYFALSPSAIKPSCAFLGLHVNDTVRADIYNTIFHNKVSGTGKYDVYGRAGNTYIGDKNLAVTGRVGGPTLPGSIFIQNPNWVTGSGLPGGSPLRGIGSAVPFTTSKTVGCTRTATGSQHANPPNVGCYA